MVLTGDWPLGFVQNAGQSLDTVSFQGLSFGGGAVSFTAEGARIDLAPETRGERSLPGATLTLHHLDAPGGGAVKPQEPLPGTVTYILPGARIAKLPSYGRLTSWLRDGLTAEYEGTTRRLDVTYTLEPGVSVDTLQWTYLEASTVSEVRPVGSLRIHVKPEGSKEERVLSLSPPEAWQVVDGRTTPVAARYVLGETKVGVALEEYDPGFPVHVRTRLLHSTAPWHHGTARAQAHVVVAGSTWQAVMAPEPTGADAFVAVFDEESRQLVSGTFLVGSGQDEAADVAVSPEGELLLAGTTGSVDFPLERERPGGHTDGFVVRMDARGSELMGSTFLGGSEDERLTGLLLTQAGEVVVTGSTTSGLEVVAPELATFSTLLPQPESEQGERTYLLTWLPRELDGQLLSQVTYKGPALATPQVFLTCAGDLVVGVRTLGKSMDCEKWPDLTYTMRQYGQDYARDHDPASPPPGTRPPGGWGYHALRWRYYEANDPASPNYRPSTLDWSLATRSIPTNYLYDSDTAALVDLEEQVFTPANPPGGWVAGWAPFVDDLALAAAIAEWKYGSPVYTLAQATDVSGRPFNFPIAIERVTFDVCVDPLGSSYNGEGLDVLCDFAHGWIGHVSCTFLPMGQGFHVSIKELEASVWKGAFIWYQEHWSFTARYPSWFVPGTYIADPPDEDPEAGAKMEEGASRLRELLVVTDLPAARSDYVGGQQVSTSAQAVNVRSTNLR